MAASQLPRRSMIFLPELAPNFVLAVQDAHGWSVRDYSSGRAVLRFGRDLGCAIPDLLETARGKGGFVVDAPLVPLQDHRFWKRLTDELGSRLLGLDIPGTAFRSLDERELRRLTASRPVSERNRLSEGPSSTGWITWNAMHLLDNEFPNGAWWASVSTLLESMNPLNRCPLYPVPGISFWRPASPSPKYALPEDPALVDMVFDSPNALIYVESKVNHDIALTSPGNKRRNRLIRLADCLLEEAKERNCALWIFAREINDQRHYVHLANQYRECPEMFAAELPHHSAEALYGVARRLTVVRWCDVLGQALQRRAEDDLVLAKVRGALRRRLQGTSAIGAAAAAGG